MIILLFVKNISQLAHDSCLEVRRCFVRHIQCFIEVFVCFLVIFHSAICWSDIAEYPCPLAAREAPVFQGQGLSETLDGTFKIVVLEITNSNTVQDRNGLTRSCRSVLIYFVYDDSKRMSRSKCVSISKENNTLKTKTKKQTKIKKKKRKERRKMKDCDTNYLYWTKPSDWSGWWCFCQD